jgi:hypothetical protein
MRGLEGAPSVSRRGCHREGTAWMGWKSRREEEEEL